jgi:hypothetical protein
MQKFRDLHCIPGYFADIPEHSCTIATSSQDGAAVAAEVCSGDWGDKLLDTRDRLTAFGGPQSHCAIVTIGQDAQTVRTKARCSYGAPMSGEFEQRFASCSIPQARSSISAGRKDMLTIRTEAHGSDALRVSF